MPKSTSHTTTVVILFSILTIILEFTAYYFLSSFAVTLLLTGFMALLFCHLTLTFCLHYESCFSYQLLHLMIWGIVLFLLYIGNDSALIAFSPRLFLMPGIHWAICILYCIVRNLWDENMRYSNFKGYFRNSSILFLLVYTASLIYFLFLGNTDGNYHRDLRSINFVPFLTLAGLITDFMDKKGGLSQIFLYLSDRTLIYIPYGFFIILMARRKSRLLRFLLLLLFPALVEVLQRVLLLGKGDLEDILYGLLGGFAGGLLFHLLNSIYSDVKGEDFLANSRRFSYRSTLHF